MQIGKMELEDAKRSLRKLWAPKVARYDLSRSDSFTDGFWDGRLWAAARLLDAFPDLDRARVIELLNIYERETKKAGM